MRPLDRRTQFVVAALAAACAVYDESMLPHGGGSGGSAQGGAPSQGGQVSTSGGTSSGGTSSGGTDDDEGGTSSSGSGAGGGTNGGTSSGGASAQGGTALGGAAQGGAAHGGSALGGTAQGGTAQGGATPAAGGSSGGTAETPLFSDDFESGVSRWTPNTTGDWNVVSDGTQVYEQSSTTTVLHTATAGESSWGDQTVQARVKVMSFGSSSTSYFACVYARYVDDNNHYCLAIRPDARYVLRKRTNGSNTTIGSAFTGIPFQVGVWYTFKLEIVGSTLNAYVDNVLFATATDTAFTQGRAGIGTTNAVARFDDVVVFP
ncbi:MAG: hypothetical protein QM756_41050 [Polyangiaceae bacterium]